MNPSDEPDFKSRAIPYTDALHVNAHGLGTYTHISSRGAVGYISTGNEFLPWHFSLKVAQFLVLLGFSLLFSYTLPARSKQIFLGSLMVPSVFYFGTTISFEAAAGFLSILLFFLNGFRFFLVLMVILFLDLGVFAGAATFYLVLKLYQSARNGLPNIWAVVILAAVLAFNYSAVVSKYQAISGISYIPSGFEVVLRPAYALVTLYFGSAQGLISTTAPVLFYSFLLLFFLKSRSVPHPEVVLAFGFIVFISLLFPFYSYGKYFLFLLPFFLNVLPNNKIVPSMAVVNSAFLIELTIRGNFLQ